MKTLLPAIVFLACAMPATANIGAADFFAYPDTLTARLSPDGKQVALITSEGEDRFVYAMDTSSKRKQLLLDIKDFSENEASVSSVTWIDNDTLAVQFIEIRKGVQDLLDTRRASYMLILDTDAPANGERTIYSVRTKGWLLDSMPDTPDKFLYAKSGPYSKTYTIDASNLQPHKSRPGKLSKIDNGQFVRQNEVSSVKGYVSRWFVDNDHTPIAVIKWEGRDKIALNTLDAEGEEQTLKTWHSSKMAEQRRKGEKTIFPIALADTPNSFYCLDFTEEEERSVYKVNYETDDVELVYEAESYKIIDLILSTEDNLLIGLKTLKDGAIHFDYLDQQDRSDDSGEPTPTAYTSTVGRSSDGSISLVYHEDHNDPGTYSIINHDSGKETIVGSHYPALENRLSAQQLEGRIDVEGLEIPYLLTLPGKDFKPPHPLLVHPHGGPIGVHDSRYFTEGTQFFAANGYAVLRVNFRGSSGYNEALEEAGKKQWGKLMLEDLRQATLKVIESPDIDASRVCAVGFSYGGYASLMLPLLHPELYQCGSSFAGVTDLNLHLNTTVAVTRHDKWLKEHVGDSAAEYDALKAVSPVYLASKLDRPVQIVHGAKDEVVDIEHGHRLKRMLEKHGKEFEWHEYPEMGHNSEEIEQEIDLYRRILAFIEAQIGGPS